MRVIALKETDVDEKIAYIYGRGNYVGRHTNPKYFNGRVPNPKIELDNGKIIWGYQCWWGEERKVEERYKDYEFVEIEELEE